jgi:hypothetical protein
MGTEQTGNLLRTTPNGEFLGTMVRGSFLLTKESKVRLENINILRCKEHAIQGLHPKV